MVYLIYGEMNLNAILTNRQNQIAKLIAWGATKKEVAIRLFISERTVENHCRAIYDKVEVDTVNELAAWWFCREFKISLDLSPRTRSVIASVLLLIYTSTVCSDTSIYTRRINRRNPKIEIRIREL